MRLTIILIVATSLGGCRQDLGRPRTASAPSPKNTTINVKVLKISKESRTSFLTLTWSFDHDSVVNGSIPALGGLFDVDMLEEMFHVELSKNINGKWSTYEQYPIGRAKDGQFYVFGSVGGIYRVSAKETEANILEDALVYLKSQAQWELYKSLNESKGH